MKKLIAILLVLVLAFSLVACGEAADTAADEAAPAADAAPAAEAAPAKETDTSVDESIAEEAKGSTKAYPNCNEDGSINLDTIAHFDAEYDYSQNERFKIRYLATASGPLYTAFADAIEMWCNLINCEYMGFFSAEGDSDLFMTTLQNDIDQGVKGFALDPDSTIYPQIARFLQDYPEVAWMSVMGSPRDGEEVEGLDYGNLVHPFVGFNDHDAGYWQAERLVQWKEENLADVDWSEIGCLSFDFSTSAQLHARVDGAKDGFLTCGAATGLVEGENFNWFVCDGVAGGISVQGGLDACSPVISTNDYKYWLVVGLFDDYAQAAASVLDGLGLTETSCCVAFGGSGLIIQLDAEQYDSFRYALFTAQSLYAEPILGCVYACLNGWATPDTIWPKWVKASDHGGEGHTYAMPLLPTCWLSKEEYKDYLAWCDLYTHSSIYGYDQSNVTIDSFSPFVDEVPASYAE